MSEQEPLLVNQGRRTGDIEAHHNDADHESSSWRQWISETLESQRLHKTVIALITIDAICVIADIAYTFLSDGCEPADFENPPWLEVLAHISLAITTFFLIEIPLTLYAFGPRFYLPLGPVPHASLHLFDAIIIIVTFVLEVVLKGREAELAGLLILFRLWRLVKLVGGIAVGAGEINEETNKQLAEAQVRLDEQEAALLKAREENQRLKGRIALLEGGQMNEI